MKMMVMVGMVATVEIGGDGWDNKDEDEDVDVDGDDGDKDEEDETSDVEKEGSNNEKSFRVSKAT